MPNVWMHKENSSLCLATPWWEILPNDEALSEALSPMSGLIEAVTPNSRIPVTKWGMLTQVGWLLQNENDIWAGFTFQVQDQFEDLGEL